MKGGSILKKSKIALSILICCAGCLSICWIIVSRMGGKVRIYEKKEELFVFFNHHQTELDALLEEMKEAYKANGEKAIYLSNDGRDGDYSFPVAEALMHEYPIMGISVNIQEDSNGDKTFAIRISFQQVGYFILADDYWGIYYAETGRPLPHAAELAESGGVYYSTYGCIYETENISENWYYYRERW